MPEYRVCLVLVYAEVEVGSSGSVKALLRKRN